MKMQELGEPRSNQGLQRMDSILWCDLKTRAAAEAQAVKIPLFNPAAADVAKLTGGFITPQGQGPADARLWLVRRRRPSETPDLRAAHCQ
jgi:hypothetical protein